MKFGEITRFMTGVAIPVFSIKTEENCGTGDFVDLIKFAHFCKKASLDVIQILPVNDTGMDASPYNALSAFALHPIYIRLDALADGDLKWDDSFTTEIAAAKERLNALPRVDYLEVRSFKEAMLKKIYLHNEKKIKSSKLLTKWISENKWVVPYAVYRAIKDTYMFDTWLNWKTMKDPSESDLNNYWKEHETEVLFFAWVQFELEKQLTLVSKTIEEMGLRLKGDIPILINEDSADVWYERRLFDLKGRAGAPPDMFSDIGQNWGFPCYNWDVLKKEDYSFWRARLKQAAKFYHAYRIDHVLGFFRIWRIPETETTGRLGHFDPCASMSLSNIMNAGFSDYQVRSFANPSFTKSYLRSYFGNSSEYVINAYFIEDSDGNFSFNSVSNGEKAILALKDNDDIKNKLLDLYRDRLLVQPKPDVDSYQPTWLYYKSRAFHNMDDGQRYRLRELIDRTTAQNEKIWGENALTLLSMMCETTDMLVCAEDLGAVPKCVPGVLEKLNILSLRVERWARDYHIESSPYIDPGYYPRLSVCSPSVHDTSVLRGWWEEGGWDKNQYYYLLNLHGGAPHHLTTEVSAAIIRRNMRSNSMLTIFPLQDFLAIHDDLRMPQPEDERVNVPGTVGASNWSFRMKDNVERLLNYDNYTNYLKSFIDERRNRQF
ncbi:4-alpha-glucanotransferase [Candidatus Magnetomonas plexicatena]|uniref:4-alpha-glucanotransferase n=1 Tax=Candidatus Magnetomonas plexicatena TaxID=2552947 RepID=UPI001C77939A|nr:4-alpha-glucanotransferase [Nitrospirales bacterium LBB_01]